jgi:hypothetical protein
MLLRRIVAALAAVKCPDISSGVWWEIDDGKGSCAFSTTSTGGTGSANDPFQSYLDANNLTFLNKVETPGQNTYSSPGTPPTLTITTSDSERRRGSYEVRVLSSFTNVLLGLVDGNPAGSALFRLASGVADAANPGYTLYSGAWRIMGTQSNLGGLSNAAVYVPLPASALLLFGGLAGIGFVARRNRKAAVAA